mmetsp:Transcript_33035/g.60899  ORF Transcript_33035/g.60899 Transcript_33035/m.60899 type:complete len:243 (-) Transcript_33035:50-778(-)
MAGLRTGVDRSVRERSHRRRTRQVQSSRLLDLGRYVRLHRQVQRSSPPPAREGLPVHRRRQGYHPHPGGRIDQVRRLQVRGRSRPVARLRLRAKGTVRRLAEQGRIHQDGVRHPRRGRREDVRPRPLGGRTRQEPRFHRRGDGSHQGRQAGRRDRLRAVVPVLPEDGGRIRQVRRAGRRGRVQVPRRRGAGLRPERAQHQLVPNCQRCQAGWIRRQVRVGGSDRRGLQCLCGGDTGREVGLN